MKKVINWRIFLILLSLCLLSIACVFPYIVTIQGDLLSKAGIPIYLIFAAQFIQSIFLFSICIFFGLLLAQKTGFHLPFIEAILEKKNSQKVLKKISGRSIIAGIIAAVAIYSLDILFTISGASITTHQSFAPVWQRLLASFYGGITEEVLMRLFLMTVFAWIGMKLFKQAKPNKTIVIISILLAAIIFGLGHLPITASMTQITPLVVVRGIILNSIGGIIFGWLYWVFGLESAIIAHFTADIFLLTLLPLLIK